MIRIAVLDDYQNVALSMADSSVLDARADVSVCNDHPSDPDAVVARLLPFQVVRGTPCATFFGGSTRALDSSIRYAATARTSYYSRDRQPHRSSRCQSKPYQASFSSTASGLTAHPSAN